jgi:c-di-GMP-related signal transduction protein
MAMNDEQIQKMANRCKQHWKGRAFLVGMFVLAWALLKSAGL